MALTNSELSVWELAHRLAGEDPDKWHWPRLPLAVRDNMRLLVHEILSAHLDSILIMEKRRPDSDNPKEFYIREYLDEIYACIAGQEYPKKLLKFITVDRWAFDLWCEQSGYPRPDFWFSVEYKWPDDGEEPEIAPEEEKPRRSANQIAMDQAREMAVEIWSNDSDLTIAEVVRQIREAGIAAHFVEKTVRKWVRPVAPPAVRNRPGRPRKGSA